MSTKHQAQKHIPDPRLTPATRWGGGSRKKMSKSRCRPATREGGSQQQIVDNSRRGRSQKIFEIECRPPIRGGIKEKLSKSSFRPPTRGGGGGSDKKNAELEVSTANSRGGWGSKNFFEIELLTFNSRWAGHTKFVEIWVSTSTRNGGRGHKKLSSFRPPTRGGVGLKKKCRARGFDRQLEGGASKNNFEIEVSTSNSRGAGHTKFVEIQVSTSTRNGGVTKNIEIEVPTSNQRPQGYCSAD